MTEFELLYRSTLDLSMTSEEKDRFKTKLKISHCHLSNFSVTMANMKLIFLQNK